ncbi:MAG: EAL domain-containing protein [Gallionella sp.]|nr:EAL domain-containing protein [Gallionella sp.]MDD4946757.1 EAL domain-containing protein [Gallionella sp.]
MTLFRQLFIGTSIVFLVLMALVEGVYITNARFYLQEQLASHAQDVATSLGMVLPPSLADKDLVRADVTVSAVFDRGYYQSIVVVSSRGEKLIEKNLAAAPPEVPVWFTQVFPIQTPSAESLITKGWQQLGRIIVTSHPNFAYKQLWRTSVEATAGLFLLYILSLFAIHAFLTRVLRPLSDIEQAAKAISERDFQQIKTLPSARELRSVVLAINSMSAKLFDIIAHEVRQATRFRAESRKDVLTGLDNRRGFEEHVHALLEHGADLTSGVMFMLQVSDFKLFNMNNGYQEGDVLLKDIATCLRGIGAERELLRCRINGATFAVIAFNIGREEADQLGKSLSTGVLGVIESRSALPVLTLGCGGVFFSGNKATLKALLAQSDRVVLQSASTGTGASLLEDLLGDEHGKGSQYWRQLIQEAISEERIVLFAQSVKYFATDKRPLSEVVGRLKNAQGELVPAGQFIPMADRFQLTPIFDLSVLKRLLGRMASQGGDDQVAINLSIHSICSEELLNWLTPVLKKYPSIANRLVFEFTEFGIVQDRIGIEKFVTQIRRYGAEFAVDNFGLHHSAFEYLQRLKPVYVKLSPAYIRGLHINHENQFFISSVVNITRSLDIQVFALGVEELEMLPLLQELGVEGIQGYVNGGLVESISPAPDEVARHLSIDP